MKPQPSILLLRHGLTEHNDGFYGSTDSQLTETGREAMLSAVAGYQFDHIISSPRQRCALVAQTLAKQHACHHQPLEDWQEYHFGDWERVSIKHLWATQATELEAFWQNPYQHRPPNAEPFDAFMQRLASARDKLSTIKEQRLLIITHAGVIRGLRLLAQQTEQHEWLTYPVAHASLHQLCPLSGQVTPMTNDN